MVKLDYLNRIKYSSDFEDLKQQFKRFENMERLEILLCCMKAIQKNEEMREKYDKENNK